MSCVYIHYTDFSTLRIPMRCSFSLIYEINNVDFWIFCSSEEGIGNPTQQEFHYSCLYRIKGFK